jgi:hypothetical protein
MNIAEIIQQLTNLNGERANLNQRVGELTAAIGKTEAELIDAIEKQGLRSVQVEGFTATISSTDYGSIEDYDAFTKYVTDNNATYLFQRRLMQKSIAELRQIEGEIPGITFFKKNSISLRKN